MSEQSQVNHNLLPVPKDVLSRLARRANEAHQRVANSLQAAVANALEVGGALLEAKDVCDDGKFTAWLKANFDGGLTTARGYMRMVANWNQLGGDPQRAAGLSQREVNKLLKGLPCYDGRQNPHVRRLPAPADAPVAASLPSSSSAPANGECFTLVERLLEDVVAELRRLAGGGEWASYAEHVLQPLEHIRQGIPMRHWFWEILPKNG